MIGIITVPLVTLKAMAQGQGNPKNLKVAEVDVRLPVVSRAVVGMLPNLKRFAASVILLVSGWSGFAYADDYQVGAGYFSLEGRTSSQTARLSNVGLYRFTYSLDIGDHFEFKPGYSLYLLGTSKVDLGYGLDLGFAYYPLTFNRELALDSNQMSWRHEELFRPFVSISFHQRQFQSINSGYAGLGLEVGTEVAWSEMFYVFAQAGFNFLKGPLDSRIQEIVILGGLGKASF
jgi:hypothetical protein